MHLFVLLAIKDYPLLTENSTDDVVERQNPSGTAHPLLFETIFRFDDKTVDVTPHEPVTDVRSPLKHPVIDSDGRWIDFAICSMEFLLLM
jgi:hypothetical protein